MEQNPPIDPSSEQFRQQLNQWFEQHGVLDNLRSHLRSVMITALQQTEIRLRPHQKTTPKIQSMNLLVAEYLIKQGCHYTLSILMSELPALSNFASGAILFHCRPKTGEKSKPREKYRFQENEVVEILNSLGVSSQDENLKVICESYNRNKEEESLLECLLRFVPKMEPKRVTKRCGSESGHAAWGEAQVGDAGKNDREDSHHVTVRRYLSRMSDSELKRAVEEENERRMRELIERERRIQNHLRSHEEEVMQRLQLAEKELNARRETIDRELSERQLHLGRIAFQLKDKHSEIMELSRNFAAIKSENVTLTAKLDSVQVELNELREELEKKTEMIERLEAERMSMKCHVQEYLKWKSREAVTSNGVCRKGPEPSRSALKADTGQAVNSDSSQSDESCGEAVLERVKARVEALEEENTRICEKYSRYKKRFEIDEDSEVIVPDIREEECVTVVEASVDPPVAVTVAHKEVETYEEVVQVPVEITPRKKVTVEEDRKVLIPTMRQQKNREYYLQSRSLLEVLEKSTGLVNESASGSTSDASWSSKLEGVSEKVKGGVTGLSDLECLTLLKETTRPEVMEACKGDEGS